MYIFSFIDILYAAHANKKWLPDYAYDGYPKHVGVNIIIVQWLV
jgi:hypothetical protein